MSEQEARQPELPCPSGKRIRRGIMWEHSVWRKQAQPTLKMKLLVHCSRRSLFFIWFYCKWRFFSISKFTGVGYPCTRRWWLGDESAYLFWLVTTHSLSGVRLGDAGLCRISRVSLSRESLASKILVRIKITYHRKVPSLLILNVQLGKPGGIKGGKMTFAIPGLLCGPC